MAITLMGRFSTRYWLLARFIFWLALGLVIVAVDFAQQQVGTPAQQQLWSWR